MSTRSRGESASLVLAILALFGLLILLIGSLDELSFQPGKILPRIESSEDSDPLSQQTTLKLSKKDRIYAAILAGLTLVSLACVLIFRKLRKELFQYLFTVLALILPLALAIGLFSRLLASWLQRESGEVAAPGPAIPEAVVANPPTWSLALAAGAVAFLAIGALAFLVIRWLAFREYVEQRKIEQEDITAEQQAIVEHAASTATRIRQGNSLQGEVIRCYREMDQLLSKRRRIKPTYLTPREFADSLGELGIRSMHIRQLTELFELVRYGDRDDQSMAQQALACLDRLQSVYGAEEEHEIAP